MSSDRSHTCCVIIPVRIGVFIVSTLFLIGSTIFAIGGWYGALHREKVHMTKNQETSIVFFSLSHTALAIFSLFGLIGAIIKRRSFVSAYSSVMSCHLGFSLGISVYFIYTLFFKVGEEDVNNCIANHSKDSNKEEECKKDFHYFRSMLIGFSIIFWLLQFWGYLIVAQYVSQLKEEDEPAYPPPAEIAATAPPLATTWNPYSFSTPQNSYGQQNASNHV